MSTLAKIVMGKFYRQAAGDPARLPWHRDTPSPVLISAVEARNGRGRALHVEATCEAFRV